MIFRQILYLLNNSLLLVKALLRSRSEDATRWATKFPGNLLTLGLRGELGDTLPVGDARLLGPLGTLLLSGVTRSDILTLLFLDGLTGDNIILNLVLVVPGLALRLIDGLTLLRTSTLADQGGMAETDRLLKGDLLVLNEAALLEVLLALLFLLRLKVGGVGGVAPLGVAMVTLDLLIILGLLNHDDLVNAPLSSSSDRGNVKVDISARSLVSLVSEPSTSTLPGSTVISLFMVMVVIVVVVAGALTGRSSGTGVEREGVGQGLPFAGVVGPTGGSGKADRTKDEKADLKRGHQMYTLADLKKI